MDERKEAETNGYDYASPETEDGFYSAIDMRQGEPLRERMTEVLTLLEPGRSGPLHDLVGLPAYTAYPQLTIEPTLHFGPWMTRHRAMEALEVLLRIEQIVRGAIAVPQKRTRERSETHEQNRNERCRRIRELVSNHPRKFQNLAHLHRELANGYAGRNQVAPSRETTRRDLTWMKNTKDPVASKFPAFTPRPK